MKQNNLKGLRFVKQNSRINFNYPEKHTQPNNRKNSTVQCSEYITQPNIQKT